MDLFVIMKDRYMFLSFSIILVFVSLFLLFAIWKKRTDIPKSLTVIITIICTIMIISLLFVFVFAVSFSYNSYNVTFIVSCTFLNKIIYYWKFIYRTMHKYNMSIVRSKRCDLHLFNF